jgi:hypothetical protein
MESVLDIYPELVEEIKKKDAENKKKRKELASKNRKGVIPKKFVAKEEQKKEPTKIDDAKIAKPEIKNADTFKDVGKFRDTHVDVGTSEDIVEHENSKEQQRATFDINDPYVSWIKEEVEKSAEGITMSFPSIKEKMGGEFTGMHDLRIFYGLQKILLNIGIKVEHGYKARDHAIVMKKTL